MAKTRVESPLVQLGRLLVTGRAESTVPWDLVVPLARQHRLSPLLFWRLSEQKEGDLASVPAELFEALRIDFHHALSRTIEIQGQLAQILGALAGAAVPALVVKGAAVGAFYPHPELRLYSDLDVLVPQGQLERAEAALVELGYRPWKPNDWWLEHHFHLPPMLSDDGRLVVEIHWRLDHDDQVGKSSYSAALPVQDLWARAVSWSVGGQPALRLDPIDTVLHLCRHAVVQHRTQMGLQPVCDVAQIVAGWDSEEWHTLARRAVDYGLARPVYLVLVLADALDVAVPPAELHALQPARPLPEGILEWVLDLGGAEASPVPVALVQAAGRETFQSRARHLLWHVFMPRDAMALVYGVDAGSPRIWLTYLVRPVDLLRRYGRTVWRMLRGNGATRAAWRRESWLEEWLRR